MVQWSDPYCKSGILELPISPEAARLKRKEEEVTEGEGQYIYCPGQRALAARSHELGRLGGSTPLSSEVPRSEKVRLTDSCPNVCVIPACC